MTVTTPLQVTIYPKDTSGQDTPAVSANSKQQPFWSGEGPSFKDVLDTINPLQHIPIISSIYQSLTGDVQSTGAKLTGGALFGAISCRRWMEHQLRPRIAKVKKRPIIIVQLHS